MPKDKKEIKSKKALKNEMGSQDPKYEKPRQIPSDALFKKVMSEPLAAKEFLEHYLPQSFKERVDFTKIRVEKESYVTDELRRQLSDIVYSMPLKDKTGDQEGKGDIEEERAFIYILVENQSSSDYWIALRLWQYILQLCERHRKGKDKLPLVYPIVVYAGDKPYKAPKSFWELFEDKEEAKALMGGDYLLVDLQAMSDDEMVQKQHLGMMEYFLKNIRQRDMLRLWDEFLSKFKASVLIDKETGYIYIRWFLWYTDSKVAADKQQELSQIIGKHLSKKEKENIMRTIADRYIDEGIIQGMKIGQEQGIQIGQEQGIQIGQEQGIQIGQEQGREEERKALAKKLLLKNRSSQEIMELTGLSMEEIENLKLSISLNPEE